MKYACATLAAVVAAAAAALPLSGPALADASASARVEALADQLPKAVLKKLPDQLDRYRTMMASRFYAASPDGRVTRESLEAWSALQHAEQRANLLRQHLKNDIDGDGAVTAAESDAATRTAGSNARALAATYFQEADDDRDRTVSFAEAVAWADRRVAEESGRKADPFDFMLLDLDGDGALDFDEANRALLALVERGDAAGANP